MCLLVVAPFLPDTLAAHGGGIYLGTLCEALARRAELGLVAQIRPDEMSRARPGDGPFRYVLPVPMPERPHGFRLASHKALMLARWGFGGAPLVAAKHQSRAMTAAIRRGIAEFAPDAALVELAQTAQYLPDLGGLPKVFTDHESGVPANAHTDLGIWADRRDERLWRRYVRRFYPQADLLQAVTAEDAAMLEATLARPVAVRLPVVHVAERPQACAKAPPRALFLGNYSHHPNPEAAGILAFQVLPRLRQRLPEAELWFAGPHAERLDWIKGRPGVRIVGYADDLATLFGQVRLLLAPLYSGAGFRMKGLSALAHGVPVVTNALGARGLAAPPPARTVVESAEDLADAALRLLSDPQQTEVAGRAAHAWAREHLAPDAVAIAQLERIDALLDRRRSG